MQYFSFIISIVFLSFIGLAVLKYIFLSAVVLTTDGFRLRKWKKNGVKKINDGPLEGEPSKLKETITNFYTGSYRYLSRKVGLIPFNWLRLFLYRHLFKMNIGKHAVIHFDLEIRDGFKISIGEGTIIGDHCLLDGRGGLKIGNNFNFSSYAQVYTAEHDANSSSFAGKSLSVVIGDRAWISDNCVVLPGVNVGEGSVLAAGAIATKNLEPFWIYTGIPATKKKERNREISYNFSGTSCWFY